MNMAGETGYPDAVARGEDTHPGDAANDSANARKEWAKPGHEGRSEDNTPIESQSGFEPLRSSQEAHGSANEQDDARKEWGAGY